MIHAHSLGRAARYHPERTAFAEGGRRSTFRELHDRVAGTAAALSRHGFRFGDRLAILLPNEPAYLELLYACSWLGVVAVPVNARYSATEIDRVIADASPRGLIRHSLAAIRQTMFLYASLGKTPIHLRTEHGEAPDLPLPQGEAFKAHARG
jgi:acyl-CoA synthetase (AMP-forming)/AMP-acid ligase II